MAKPLIRPESVWNYVGQRTFGSFLKRLRVKRQYSRHSLAVISGIQERCLQEIESGLCPPTFDHIQKIATVLEAPERDLLVAAGYLAAENGT